MKDKVSFAGSRKTGPPSPPPPMPGFRLNAAFLLFPLLLCASACGRGYYYEEAVKLESQGLPLKAAAYYDLFAGKNPDDPRAPDSLFKAARIYARQFGLCDRAKPVLERLLKSYPDYEARPAAMKDLLVCPDYFPFDSRFSWTYGDSDTGGRNARQVTSVLERGTIKGGTVTKTYAGKQLVATQKNDYRLKGRDIVRTGGGRDAVVMRYPAEKGLTWTSVVDGRRTRFTVEETGVKVKVRAGEFEGCIKLKRAMAGVPSWIYEYYAPWVGKVMTSVGGKGFENRVTELLEYEENEK